MFYCRGNIFDVGMRNLILGSMKYIFGRYEQARTADVVVSQVHVIIMRPIVTFHTQAVWKWSPDMPGIQDDNRFTMSIFQWRVKLHHFSYLDPPVPSKVVKLVLPLRLPENSACHNCPDRLLIKEVSLSIPWPCRRRPCSMWGGVS